MTFRENAFTFGPPDGKQRDGNRQVGILHHPENCATDTGLLIVVGGLL